MWGTSGLLHGGNGQRAVGGWGIMRYMHSRGIRPRKTACVALLARTMTHNLPLGVVFTRNNYLPSVWSASGRLCRGRPKSYGIRSPSARTTSLVPLTALLFLWPAGSTAMQRNWWFEGALHLETRRRRRGWGLRLRPRWVISVGMLALVLIHIPYWLSSVRAYSFTS